MKAWGFQQQPFLIAGPCVVESDDVLYRVAEELCRARDRFNLSVCFKSSFDKANRSRGGAPRGPGLEEGLRSLERVRERSGLPILTDVHEPGQARAAAQVVDVLQIPAFLCRQTDLLTAAGNTGKPVNIKKGQWMAPAEMKGAVEKTAAAGAQEVAVTERGTFFGYGDLIVDMRNFSRLRDATRAAVIFDATHSVQKPGSGVAGASGGEREHIPHLLSAAAVAGADGFFLETHPEPARASSDASTQWPLEELSDLLDNTIRLWHSARDRSHD